MFIAIRSCLDKVIEPWVDFAIFIYILKAVWSAFYIISFKKFIFQSSMSTLLIELFLQIPQNISTLLERKTKLTVHRNIAKQSGHNKLKID